MKKKKILAILIIGFVSISPALACNEEEEYRQIMFSISLLSPNTLEARNQWAVLMQEQLPKIGIGVYLHESTGWGNIGSRSLNYPLIDFDYIPTYAEGGYDILFLGWEWEKDFNLVGIYDSYYPPWTGNFYQYHSIDYDNAFGEYSIAYDSLEREQLAHNIQAIIYEDLPAISILYDQSFFLFNQNISGVKIEKEHYRGSYAGFDNLWTQCVYGSLFQRNLSNQIWEPYIAKNATIIPNLSEHGYLPCISVVVDINPDVKFSNGDPVLVEDIKYSYDLHLSPNAHTSTYSNLVRDYLGWSNDSIVEVDSDTIRFDFDKQFNFPFSVLSYGIIDKSVVEPIISSYGYDVYDQLPFSANVSDALVTSCGPFKLVSYNLTEGKVELIQNEYWFGSAQKLSNISFLSIPDKDEAFSMLVEGEVDILDVTYGYLYSEVVNPPDFELSYKVILCRSLSHQEMAINMRHPMIGNGELTPVGTHEAGKYLRKAISHTIPRQKIIDECLEGMGFLGVTPVPHGCIGFDESLEPYAYDLDLAIEYTEKAGYVLCSPISNTSGWVLLPFLICLVYIAMLKMRKKLEKF
jgi:ABC-type transport system substrate-binding protein